jgi:hypothetical protein
MHSNESAEIIMTIIMAIVMIEVSRTRDRIIDLITIVVEINILENCEFVT